MHYRSLPDIIRFCSGSGSVQNQESWFHSFFNLTCKLCWNKRPFLWVSKWAILIFSMYLTHSNRHNTKSTLSHSGWCWILKWRCPLLAIGKTWKVVPWDSPPEPPPPTSKPRRCDLYTQTYFSLIEVFFFLSGQDPLSCSHAASH